MSLEAVNARRYGLDTLRAASDDVLDRELMSSLSEAD